MTIEYRVRCTEPYYEVCPTIEPIPVLERAERLVAALNVECRFTRKRHRHIIESREVTEWQAEPAGSVLTAP